MNKEKFLTLIKKTKSGCWEWQRHKVSGYGQATYKGRQMGAHRISFLLFKGEIPKGKLICHKCDNPPCVNPSHLYVGTHQDNSRDMLERARGTKKPTNTKTNEIIKRITLASAWRKRREKAKIKLSTLATIIKMRKGDLSRWERGITIPRPENVNKVEKALKRLGV